MLHSIVIPVFNEVNGIEELRARVTDVIDTMPEDFEVILVNDGSTDGSAGALDRVHELDARFKVLHLSRNYGHQLALTAGVKWARGQTVTVMDADLQDPPEVIAAFVAKWREGFDVVHGVRSVRFGESRFKLWTADVFYRLIRHGSEVELPLESGDFRLMDRKVVDAFLSLRERNRYVRGLVSWLGFRQTEVRYERQARQFGSTHYSLSKMLKFTWNGLTSFSDLPVRLMFAYGVVGAAVSAVLWVVTLVASVAETLQAVAGFGAWDLFSVLGSANHWVFALLFLGHGVIACCGILGIYLVRIYDEVRARPLFLVDRSVGFDGAPERSGVLLRRAEAG